MNPSPSSSAHPASERPEDAADPYFAAIQQMYDEAIERLSGPWRQPARRRTDPVDAAEPLSDAPTVALPVGARQRVRGMSLHGAAAACHGHRVEETVTAAGNFATERCIPDDRDVAHDRDMADDQDPTDDDHGTDRQPALWGIPLPTVRRRRRRPS